MTDNIGWPSGQLVGSEKGANKAIFGDAGISITFKGDTWLQREALARWVDC